MHSGPDYFLVRPGMEDGKPGPIVPLIAMDQLPDWMQLAGVPRELRPEQTNGLTNVGIINREDDDIYEVRLHHDKIRAILKATTTRSLSGQEGQARDDDSRFGTMSRPNSAPVHEESATKVQGKQSLQRAERMLSASRHSGVGNVARGGKPIRPHMTQAMYDKAQPRVVPCSSSGIRDRPQVITGSPGTAFCRHWCHHGTCKWGWNCKFQHRMPTTAEGLREVGLRGFPTWYLLLMRGGGVLPSMAASPSFGPDDLFEGFGVNNHPGTTDMTIPPAQQHTQPSLMDVHLMQGHMSALLAGPSAMSNRQRLRQVKEMRQICASLHTNASLAANAAIIRRQAERQQLGRLSGLSDLPVATRAARVGAAVDVGGGGNDVDGFNPEESVNRGKRESADACAEGDESVTAPRHAEKLVDLD